MSRTSKGACQRTNRQYRSADTVEELTCCNAGHNPPLLVGKSRIRRLETGVVYPSVRSDPVDEQTLQLEAGDLLATYSDGITAARKNLDASSRAVSLLARGLTTRCA